MNVSLQIDALRREFEQIALSELARKRRLLGALTPEQEQAIEILLLSTVNELARPILQELRLAARS